MLHFPIGDPTGGDPRLSSQHFEHGTLNSLSLPIELANSLGTYSIGIPALNDKQLRIEGETVIIEDEAFLIRLRPVSPLEVSYSVTFKDPTHYPEFRLAVGLPPTLHLEARLNSRVGIFDLEGNEVAAVENPIASPSSPSWIDTSTRVEGSEIVIRYESSSNNPSFAADRSMGDSPEIGGTAVGDLYSKWETKLGDTERSFCKKEWNDCRRVFLDGAISRAEELGKSIASPPFDNEGDAARHCAWQGLMTESADSAFAERMGNAHEVDHPVAPEGEFTDGQVSGMDAYNNITGRAVGLRREGNQDAVIADCRDYAKHARLTSDPGAEQQHDGSDLIVLKKSLP
ncbi:hypothetical protein WG936_12030 [Corynebacterium sp. H127]|uniref:DUF6973 domain-containing protein n=1 Tax=Corynebacterium sp. H127 TaxID=3133418 RepID=UPI0030A493FE